MKFQERRRKGDPVQDRINDGVNRDLRGLFELSDDTEIIDSQQVNIDILYGPEPDHVETFKVGARRFGAELYRPEAVQDRGILAVAQHGYGGRARDFSKLAAELNQRGVSVLALDMHIDGDDFTRMSMQVDEWAAVAVAATELQSVQMRVDQKRIFIGQSSGGTAGVDIVERGKEQQPFDGALLIGPTLVTVNPELIKSMDDIVNSNTRAGQDAMIDWKWLAPLTGQCADEDLNRAYHAHLADTPGLPWRAAREAFAVPRHKVINRLGSIDVPTLMVRGEEDREDEVSLELAAEIAEETWSDGVEFADAIPNAAHQAHIDQPEAVAMLVEQLLEKIG